jgi:hypothetical protein
VPVGAQVALVGQRGQDLALEVETIVLGENTSLQDEEAGVDPVVHEAGLLAKAANDAVSVDIEGAVL